jgi:hypothetical protein
VPERMPGYNYGPAGTIGLDYRRRRLRWDHPTLGTRYGPRLPVGRTVRATVAFPGVGVAGAWVHLTPPRADPHSAMRTAYRHRQLARRRRNRR